MPRIVDKAAKREDILQAAMRVFARKGYNYTKMSDVAQEAGIGKGTIYEYFPGKSQLLLEAYEAYLAASQKEVDRILQSDLDPLAKIQEIIFSIVRIYARDPDLMRVFFDFWVESMHSPAGPQMDFKTLYETYRGLIRKLLREAELAGQIRSDLGPHVPSVLIALVEGTFLQWMIDPDAFDILQVAKDVVDVLMRGLRNSAPQK